MIRFDKNFNFKIIIFYQNIFFNYIHLHFVKYDKIEMRGNVLIYFNKLPMCIA